MGFVNGELQTAFMGRVRGVAWRGVDPQRYLVVLVDVGTQVAMGLVADH